MSARFIGVVCGLKSEARAISAALSALSAPASAIRVGVSGADARRAESIARDFAQAGAALIMSVGVSGGLDPALQPGDMIVTSQVFMTGGELLAFPLIDLPPIIRRVEREGASPKILSGAVYGADLIIQTAEEKSRLFQATGALAVDMESHGAARAARSANISFLAIRAIADPASRALPGAAIGAVAPDGSTRVFATLLKCVKAPGDFPALLQLGSDSSIALKSLRDHLGLFLGGLALRFDL